jgi:hypothetical protein
MNRMLKAVVAVFAGLICLGAGGRPAHADPWVTGYVCALFEVVAPGIEVLNVTVGGGPNCSGNQTMVSFVPTGSNHDCSPVAIAPAKLTAVAQTMATAAAQGTGISFFTQTRNFSVCGVSYRLSYQK